MKYFATALVIGLPIGIFSWVYWGPSTVDLSSESSLIRPNFGVPKKVTSTRQQRPVQPVLKTDSVSMPLQETDPTPKKPVDQTTDQISNLFIADCNCHLPGSEPRAITYEDEKECGADRNYLTASLKKMPESMKKQAFLIK